MEFHVKLLKCPVLINSFIKFHPNPMEDMYLLPLPYDPFAEVMSAIGHAIRSTWHTANRATPGQLVFGRDMALNVKHVADWN